MATAAELVWDLFEKGLVVARVTNTAPAEAVEALIKSTRTVMSAAGYSKLDTDRVLFDVYTRVHWDFRDPTARVFETLLEFELADFFRQRGIPA